MYAAWRISQEDKNERWYFLRKKIFGSNEIRKAVLLEENNKPEGKIKVERV